LNSIKFYIDQHGCAKNQTDGEILISHLTKAGFVHTLNVEEADYILVNSCGFINSAKKESIDAVYSAKKSCPKAKIILTGCLAERYAQTLFESMPELSGVFGNGDLGKIVEFINQVEKEKRSVKTYEQKGVCSASRSVFYNYKAAAFVKITEGCSNNCTFCAIPLIRGKVRSRSIKDVVSEIKDLLSQGIYEINLIGQDLAVFEEGLPDLFKEISKLQGDFIVRPLYIHPDHFTKEIALAIKEDSRFLPYFDIPFQSGDDEIIHKMNRKGSFEKYVELVKEIRSILPSAVLRTTFLTGFPGESDQAALNTQKFLQEIRPVWSGCFPYSREENTPAYSLKPQVPKKVAEKRAAALEEIQSKITEESLKKYIGQEVPVLIEEIIASEGEDPSAEGLALGRAWFQAPEVDGCVVVRYDLDFQNEVNSVKCGNVVNVKILNVTGVDLDSRFVSLRKEFTANPKVSFIN
jgi:ribosomal protein S12 methylthiotransferase